MGKFRKESKKSDDDLREEGIMLIKNSLKAREMSEPLLDKIYSDIAEPADYNWACYMISQSVELALKGMVKYHYESFREGHFVTHNAKLLENMSDKIPELREISESLSLLQTEYAVKLCKWSKLGRYKKLYVKRPIIEKIDTILDDIIKFIRRHHYELDS